MYLAEDTTLGRRIALKILDPSFAENGQFERRFQQEARTIASLEHPNIVPIHSLEKVGDVLAIDMPYIDGGSLCDVFNANIEKRRQTVDSVRDVLAALTCCHNESIVHRDVKPSNILIRGDGMTLLSDFGLARIMAEQHSASLAMTSSSGCFVGTPRYAPPESWDGQEPMPSWDVYSVGMVLYEAFAAKTPYDAQTPMGLVKQILERPVPPLQEVVKEVSEELSNAVASMLDRDPDKRPHDASAVQVVLGQTPEWKASNARDGSTVIRRVVGRRKPLRLALRRQKRPWRSVLVTAATAVTLLMLAGVLGNLALHRTTQPSGANGTGEASNSPGLTLSLSPYAVFDTVEPATGTLWPRHLLLLVPESAGKWTALAYESTHVWFIELTTPNSEMLKVDGHWAGYTDKAASLFQQGDVSGSG